MLFLITNSKIMSQIKTFKDLKVWNKAHNFVLYVYRITKDFPQGEKFNLISQIRRAVIYIASNIVEGFHRSSIKESLRFYNIAEASLEEAKYQLLIAKDLDYISSAIYQEGINLADEVGRMLNSWVVSQIKNSKV
jgi:four helix bundle protein